LTSSEEFVEFRTLANGMPLKFSSGTKNVPIGANDRFSVSGTGFISPEAAHETAEAVRQALLLFSASTRCGMDLGQTSLRGFGMSEYGKKFVAQQLGSERVIEDHLGITIYAAEPKPTFV
jgi:hypothetical protein